MSNAKPLDAGTALRSRIQNDFKYHAPTPEKREVHERLREVLKEAALEVEALTPTSREQSIAITHLEEALMWANAAVARNGTSAAGQ